MKILIIIIIVGVAEIFTISSLHQELGIINSIYIYLAGTALGGALLYFGWGNAISSFRKAAEIDKTWMKRIQSEPKIFSKNDARNLGLLYESVLFFVSVAFISIPGIITDVVGIFLALSSVRRFLVHQIINSHVRKSNA